MEDKYYSGCWGDVGHYLFNRAGRKAHVLPDDFPIMANVLDCGLLPPKSKQVEGEGHFLHVGAWTVLTFWDRSVDKRFGSCSAFIFRGIFTVAEMLAQIRWDFPAIWERLNFPLQIG